MDGDCVQKKKINTYKAMVRKRERRKVLGILRSRMEDVIKIELNEVRWEGRSGYVLFRTGTIGRPL